MKALRAVIMLKNLSNEDLIFVAGHMTRRSVRAKEVLITQGERGEEFYIVKKGTFVVKIDSQVSIYIYLSIYLSIYIYIY